MFLGLHICWLEFLVKTRILHDFLEILITY